MTDLQSFRQWLGRQLARETIETACESAFRAPPRDPKRREWDGTRLPRMKDDDGLPFLPGPPSELRLVFSWSHDGWNPYGNSFSGTTRSSTGFWLINMGLPLDMRYLEENIFYFGAIPGKPNGSQLNHTLDLLVDVFLAFWNPGVWYSRTAKCPARRLVKAALVPQISDVIASRQGAGRGAVNTGQFCVFCLLHHDDIECSDRAAFTPRDDEQQRAWAYAWRDAQSEDEQDTLAEAHDVRWTPLFRLPYYSATLDNIPESLHLFLEFLIQVFVRRCLRVHLVIDGVLKSEEIALKTFPRPTPAQMNNALRILISAPEGILDGPAQKKLEDMREDVLFHLCQDFGLRYAGFKRQLVMNLSEWASDLI